MAGVQIAGLESGINWQNIINELITADSAGMNQVQAQQTNVNNQVPALGSLSTDLTNLEGSILNLEDPSVFSAVTAASTTSGSTWQVTAESGAPIGNTTVDVSNLATATRLSGAGDISQVLVPGGDASGVTVANLDLADPVTAGTFTVDGAPVTVTTSESLQDVFNAISTATGGAVTASYDAGTDKVTLASTGGNLVLGAANDTSNFLQAMNLANTGSTSSTSTATLGAVNLTASIANSGLATALSGQDGSGNGSFTVNGVTIDYNTSSDSLSTLFSRIDDSGAGVNASYDANTNAIVLTNTITGDTGISVGDVSGNLAAAMGLTTASGAALSYGENATFSVNGGPVQTSASNTLTAAQLGVTGLSVTANSTGQQTIAVTADTSGMMTAIQAFITDFNQFQTDITTDTSITTSSTGSVVTSLLSSDHEVGDWGSQLEMTAFSAGDQLSGAITSLDALGIDFNGTSAQLVISDSAQLQQALSSNPSGVAAFFQTAKTGFGSIMNASINDILTQNQTEQSNLQSESTDLGNQITQMQTQLAAEQQTLETEFTNMESMEAQYQTEEQSLASLSGSSSSSSSTSATTADNSAATTSASNAATSTSTSSTSSS